jgi:CDGSH-type Zn-finger protein
LIKLNQVHVNGIKSLISIFKHEYMPKTKITVNDNVSLKIEGDFEIADRTGAHYDLGGREIVSLCRCGHSNNKPFCDGSHKNQFEHSAVAFALPPKKVL